MNKKLLLLLLGLTLVLTGCAGGASVGGAAAASAAGPGTSAAVSSAAQSASASQAASAGSADYSVCTDIPSAQVKAFAEKIQSALLDGDWKQIAGMCAYPVRVDGTLYDTAEALTAARLQPSDSFLDAVRKVDCASLFANSDGIMMGNGEVWFSEVLDSQGASQGLKILSINDVT